MNNKPYYQTSLTNIQTNFGAAKIAQCSSGISQTQNNGFLMYGSTQAQNLQFNLLTYYWFCEIPKSVLTYTSMSPKNLMSGEHTIPAWIWRCNGFQQTFKPVNWNYASAFIMSSNKNRGENASDSTLRKSDLSTNCGSKGPETKFINMSRSLAAGEMSKNKSLEEEKVIINPCLFSNKKHRLDKKLVS